MPPHNAPGALHPIFADILAPMIGTPRPLVAANHRSLACIIAGLINDNEPLLKAEADGTTVTVSEIGGPAVMIVTVTGGNS